MNQTTQERLRDKLDKIIQQTTCASHFLEVNGCVGCNPEQTILQLIETELLQKKVNIFTQFKVAMTAQDLSARPTPPARFRTPLEELSVILESEIPLQQRTTLRGEK